MGTEAGNWKGGGNRRDGIGNKEKGQERQHRKWKGIIRNRRVGTERELGGPGRAACTTIYTGRDAQRKEKASPWREALSPCRSGGAGRGAAGWLANKGLSQLITFIKQNFTNGFI